MNHRLTIERLGCVRGERMVFRDVSLEIEGGGALVLTGANGAGKSSLLRTIAGLIAPQSGRILWNGLDAREDPEAFRRDLVFVGHADAVKPAFTVAENARVWARLAGTRDVGPALAHFGLDRLASMPVAILSAGQRRRLNLARLMLAPAPLWLLDEPGVTLDRAALGALDQAIARHRTNGGLVLVATHGDVAIPGAATFAMGAPAP